MTTAEAIRVLTQEEAVAKLIAAGYTREKCPTCKGEARHTIIRTVEDWQKYACSACEGTGWRWTAPLTR